MRLINADKLPYDDVKGADGSTYRVYYSAHIENAPTVFDLKSVITQLEEKVHEYSIKSNGKDSDREILQASKQGKIQGIEIALNILKSAMFTQIELKNCPICGKKINIGKDVYIPERDYHPTLNDSDSGSAPISLHCVCGLEFCTGTYDFKEFAKAWNTRS